MEVSPDTCGQFTVRRLLLLLVFVVKASADCPKPQTGVNIVLTNEALLLNDFPDGLEVTLECGNGFVKESGSGIISCIDGNWTEADLKCKKKDCGLPKPQPNMSFNTSAGTLYGAVIRVVCDKGFQVSGSSYKQCYAFGWSGKATCEIVTCGKPANVTNGKNSWDSQDDPKYGQIILYVCNDGYTLVGKDSLVCNETGEYDSQPPTCEGVTTGGRITTKTPTSTPPAQEASTSTDSPATPTAHRDKTVPTSETPTASPSPPGEHDEAVDTNKDIGYMPLIVSVICVALVVCIVALILHKLLLRRKGSVSGTVPIY